MSFDLIRKSLDKKQFTPLYYFFGEEAYFIDKLTEKVDASVLEPHERDFNREVFYGGDTNAGVVLNACRSFPVMAERRLVMLKEAHSLNKKEWDKITTYLKKPTTSTVFVLAFKGKGAALPKAAADAAKANGATIFESKRLYDKDVIRWTMTHLQEQGIEFDAEIPDILVSHLGTNIPLIENELEKIAIYLSAQSQKKLDKNLLYEMVNIDKEFNVFELISAMAKQEAYRSHLIIDKLSANAKANPAVMMIGNLYNFFSQLATLYSLKLMDVNAVKDGLKVNYYAALDLVNARKNFPLPRVYRCISYILDADLMTKGIISTEQDDRYILKTLVWKILNQ